MEIGSDTRPASTAIYYLLTTKTYSALHRLRFDEVYHFYAGDPVELVLLDPGRGMEIVTLGPRWSEGERVQQVVPGGTWQGSRLLSGAWALLGTTMAPGFDFADCELASPTILDAFAAHRDILAPLLPRPHSAL